MVYILESHGDIISLFPAIGAYNHNHHNRIDHKSPSTVIVTNQCKITSVYYLAKMLIALFEHCQLEGYYSDVDVRRSMKLHMATHQ